MKKTVKLVDLKRGDVIEPPRGENFYVHWVRQIRYPGHGAEVYGTCISNLTNIHDKKMYLGIVEVESHRGIWRKRRTSKAGWGYEILPLTKVLYLALNRL